MSPETCAAITFFGPCPFAAAATVTMGCVHEHIRVGPMCEEHEEESRNADAADCLACHSGADAHRCGLSFINAEPLGPLDDEEPEP